LSKRELAAKLLQPQNLLDIIKANTTLRKMERIIIRKLKRSDFAEYYKNELQYYRELKKDPTFGIGTYGNERTVPSTFVKL